MKQNKFIRGVLQYTVLFSVLYIMYVSACIPINGKLYSYADDTVIK